MAPTTRRWYRLCGDRPAVLERAHRLVVPGTLWVSSVLPDAVHPSQVHRQLGLTVPMVVLDLAGGFRAEVLAQVHGLVHRGGVLLTLEDDAEHPWVAPWSRLQAWPFDLDAVGDRTRTRLPPGDPITDARIPPFVGAGTAEQAALVARLVQRWAGPPSLTALIADRGRGKSAALGLALAQVGGGAVTGPSPNGTAEVRRWVDVPHLDPLLAQAPILVVDEAAGLPLPLLERLVARNRGNHVVLATTTHGYEGTGRGFSLAFLASLARRRPVDHDTLLTPIRWNADDPLERRIFETLLLDAEPWDPTEGVLTVRAVGKDELIADEGLLRDVFGLLIQAHYRTTPTDLQHLLDAPNLSVNVAFWGERAVGVNLLAEEGRLTEARTARLLAGERLTGHAIPELLVRQAGRAPAAALRIVRSVRIATHPAARGKGVAAALVRFAQEHLAPDLFGTVFGATAEVVRFRQRHGYQVVRIGLARGARSGRPSVMMLEARSAAGWEVVHGMRAELARDADTLARMFSTQDVPLPDDLLPALLAELPAPAPWTTAELERALEAYVLGRRSFAASSPAFVQLLAEGGLEGFEHTHLIRGLLEGTLDWEAVSVALGTSGVPHAMKALRRALSTSLQPAAPPLLPSSAQRGP